MLQNIHQIGMGGQGIPDRIPKAIAELQGLTFSGPIAGVGANAALAIADSGGIEYDDTLLKVLIQNGSTALLTDDTANATIKDRRASGTLTLAGFVVGDAVQVNGNTYTAAAAPNNSQNLAPGTFAIGTTDALTAANLAAAITEADTAVFAVVLSGAIVTIKSTILGVGGNTVTLSAAASNAHATASGATLAGGTATNSISTTTNTTGNFVFAVWFNKNWAVIDQTWVSEY